MRTTYLDAPLTPLRQVKSLGLWPWVSNGSSPSQRETSDLTIYREPQGGTMQFRQIGACMQRKYAFIGIQRAIGRANDVIEEGRPMSVNVKVFGHGAMSDLSPLCAPKQTSATSTDL